MHAAKEEIQSLQQEYRVHDGEQQTNLDIRSEKTGHSMSSGDRGKPTSPRLLHFSKHDQQADGGTRGATQHVSESPRGGVHCISPALLLSIQEQGQEEIMNQAATKTQIRTQTQNQTQTQQDETECARNLPQYSMNLYGGRSEELQRIHAEEWDVFMENPWKDHADADAEFAEISCDSDSGPRSLQLLQHMPGLYGDEQGKYERDLGLFTRHVQQLAVPPQNSDSGFDKATPSATLTEASINQRVNSAHDTTLSSHHQYHHYLTQVPAVAYHPHTNDHLHSKSGRSTSSNLSSRTRFAASSGSNSCLVQRSKYDVVSREREALSTGGWPLWDAEWRTKLRNEDGNHCVCCDDDSSADLQRGCVNDMCQEEDILMAQFALLAEMYDDIEVDALLEQALEAGCKQVA
jgi:hypothetical protein